MVINKRRNKVGIDKKNNKGILMDDEAAIRTIYPMESYSHDTSGFILERLCGILDHMKSHEFEWQHTEGCTTWHQVEEEAYEYDWDTDLEYLDDY